MACTLVEFYGKPTSSRCGYCKKTKSSPNHGMHAYIMAPQDYQDLIDRGWRRSGHYCYKPNNKTTCCPSYTIRCDTMEFKLSKSHKKILKRMNKFLSDGIKEKSDITDTNIYQSGDVQHYPALETEPEIPTKSLRDVDVSNIINEQIIKNKSEGPLIEQKNGADKKSEDSRPPCKKAKQIRFEHKQVKLAAKGMPVDEINHKTKKNKNQEKSLQDFIDEIPENGRHKLKLRLVKVNGTEYAETSNETFGLYQKYQISIHNDPPEDIEEFLSFLVRSPLKHIKVENGPSEGYGSFHQQYWLDDKLIAVGVIDILPYCVSSVYFFYDPEYSFLSLGTYGSLREIQFTQKLCEQSPPLQYYYMGFYIHSCPKMRYKGKLVPSYLLCPEVYTWHLLTDEIRKKLDEFKYQRFNEDATATPLNDFTDSDIESVLISDDGRSCTRFRNYIQIHPSSEFRLREDLMEYGKLVGNVCAQRIIYIQ